MTFYSAPFTFDYVASQILVDGGVVTLTCSSLYTAIKLAQMSVEGIIYPRIAAGSGLNTLSAGVQVGLTVQLLGNWQLKFPAGSYVATIGGGNLIGGLGNVPVAYSAGVQVSLIQSAAATIVTPVTTLLPGDISAISAAVWNSTVASYPTTGTFGLSSAQTRTLAGLIPAAL